MKSSRALVDRREASALAKPRIAHLSSPRTSGAITAKYAEALMEGCADVRIFAAREKSHEFQGSLVPTRAPVLDLPFGKRALARPAFYKARLQLITMGAEIIIAEDPELLRFAAKYARIAGARLVYMPFEYYPGASYAPPALQSRWGLIERRLAPAIAAWIIPGDKIAELYAGVIAPADTVHVVYNGSPRSSPGGPPKLRRALGVGPEVKILLYQGSVLERRGLWDVLGALPLLPPSVHFAVLGMGELNRLRQDAASRGLGDRVHVLDAVPQAELADYTKDADVGLIPIHNTCVSYDLCCPGKLFEYIGAGLPLAVSRLTQLDWFVTRHGLGEVFDQESPSSLARAVLRLLENDTYRASCRARCQRLQATAVCWEVQAGKLRRAVLGLCDPPTEALRGAPGDEALQTKRLRDPNAQGGSGDIVL